MATILEKANKILNEKEQKIRPENLKQGVSYFDINGTLEELKGQTKIVAPTTGDQTITPDETYNGLISVTVNGVTNTIDPNIQAENIKQGINILGIDGNLKGGLTGIFDPSKTQTDYDDMTPLVVQNGYQVPSETMLIPVRSDGVSLLDTSSVTNMAGMFGGCSNLINIPELNTSSVANMTSTFAICSNLRNISLLDTSNVTDMTTMFYGCSNLATIPQLVTSSATNMTNMFYNCSSLTTIPQLDTSKVTNMEGMFIACSNLTTIPELNTSKVTNMYNMFMGCSKLITIPQLVTSNVTNMNMMFGGCSELSDKSLNNILAMCAGATAIVDNKTLAHIGLSEAQVERCRSLSNYQAFLDAGWLNGYSGIPNMAIPGGELSGEFNPLATKTMFDKMTPLVVQNEWTCNPGATFIPVKSDGTPLLNTSNVTSMQSMFLHCFYLTTIPLLDTSKVESMQAMFYMCGSLATIPQLVTSKVTNMTAMFCNCGVLTTIPLLDTSNVTNMESMFAGCSKLITIPQLVTSNVTNMNMMFGGCSGLITIPELNTNSVTNMDGMFNACSSLTTIPLLNTSNVTNMNMMFGGCPGLITIPELNTNSVTNMEGMFTNCSKLSDESLNNILAMCTKATNSATKTLTYIGLSPEQIEKCKTLSNYQAFTEAGWTDQ